MQVLFNKIKTTTTITFILGVLSLTWLVIDYFVIKQAITENNLQINLIEWILIVVSATAFVAFHLTVFFLLFRVTRLFYKYKKEVKLQEKKTLAEQAEKESKQNTTENSELHK